MTDRYENLKKSFHPEINLDPFTQARLIHEALSEGGEWFKNYEGFAAYLGVSTSTLRQMKKIHEFNVLPEVKFYMMQNGYQARSAYDVGKLSVEEQKQWLKERTGNTLSQKVKNDE